MGVAHTLSRRFFWAESILWKDDLIEHNATIFLSGRDSIINAPRVRAYLQTGTGKELQTGRYTSGQKEVKEADPADNSAVTVVWCADLDHGQTFDLALWRMRLKSEVLTSARRVGGIQR